jgi:hypothetical protein
MFELRFITIFLLIIWVVFFFLARKLDTPLMQGFRPRLVTLLGFFLVGTGFFFQPWIKFEFLDYINPTPEFLRQFFSGDLLNKIIQLIGVGWINKLLNLFHMFTRFNGWQIELIPTLSIWIRLCTLLPLFPFAISLLGILIGSAYRGSLAARAFGGIMIISGFISAVALLWALPGLDALGIQGNFQWALLATILGTRMGNGPWFCIIGLLLIIIGGLIELKDVPSAGNAEPDAYA